jgi:hypothetical protein
MREGPATNRSDTPDLQAKQDTPVALIAIAILTWCCILGTVWAYTRTNFGNEGAKQQLITLLCLSGALSVLLIAWLGTWRASRQAKSAAGLSFGKGCLMFVGYGMLAIIAAGIFFLAVCGTLLSGPFH